MSNAAFYSIVSVEDYRYVSDGKQHRDTNEVLYRIGELDSINLVTLYPRMERRYDLIPWAYKPATPAQIKSGNYRVAMRNGVTYYLATDKDGNCYPRTLNGKQLVTLVAEALTTCAGTILRDNDMVGLHVTYQPQVDWSAETRTTRKGSSKPNRKNRHGRNDKADTAKQARAAKRAATRKSASAAK